jgi:SAM-dependent methyltransferase
MGYEQAIQKGAHRFLFAQPYDRYIAGQALRVMRAAPPLAKRVLSVGCGDGLVEQALCGRYDLTCYDVHDAAKTICPELNVVTAFPDGQVFDYIYAVGAVVSSVDTQQQTSFLAQLFSVLRPGGTALLCAGYSSMPIDGDVREYVIDGSAVAQTYVHSGPFSFDVTTSVDDGAGCTLRYYPWDVRQSMADYYRRFRVKH